MTFAVNYDALTTAHKAVEDALIDLRDNRISVLGGGNGLVVREATGEESGIVRMGTRDALRLGIAAYLDALASDEWASRHPDVSEVSYCDDEDEARKWTRDIRQGWRVCKRRRFVALTPWEDAPLGWDDPRSDPVGDMQAATADHSPRGATMTDRHTHTHPVVDNEHTERQKHEHGPAGRHPHRHTTLGLAPSHSDAPNNATTTDIVLGPEHAPWRDSPVNVAVVGRMHSHKIEVGGIGSTLTHTHPNGSEWHEHSDAPHEGRRGDDLYRLALEIIAGDKCSNYTDGRACLKTDRTADAQYEADRICDACIAWAALNGLPLPTGPGKHADVQTAQASAQEPHPCVAQVQRLADERDRLFHAGERLVRSVTTVIGAPGMGRGGTVRPALEEFRATLIDVARRNG
jgi:hypothetical protein